MVVLPHTSLTFQRTDLARVLHHETLWENLVLRGSHPAFIRNPNITGWSSLLKQFESRRGLFDKATARATFLGVAFFALPARKIECTVAKEGPLDKEQNFA